MTTLAAAAGLLLAGAAPAAAQVSRDEALALVFPGAAITAERLFLTADQLRTASELSGVKADTSLIARYTARKGSAVIGHAYVDTHTVRTKKESLLISLGADGAVRRVDVIAFLEPSEYAAPAPFLGQFPGRRLEPGVQLNRAIRPVAGATLTAVAVTDAVRRVLAIDAVLEAAAARPGGAP